MAFAPAAAERSPSGAMPPAARAGQRFHRFGPLAAVAAAVAWGLVELRAETIDAAYLNDSSVHEEMARFAAAQLAHGHLPLERWYPYLGLGSPQFLHYQSLGPTLIGLVGLALGVDRAFHWSAYLLVACWPLAIYSSARLFGLERWQAAGASVVAPFVVSATGLGYEPASYLWIGYGVWTQLWGMWALPFAWATTLRALRDTRFALAAAVAVTMTIAAHFMTGYLAVAPIVCWPFLTPSRLPERLRRALLLLAGCAGVAAWVVYPVLHFAPWASLNEFLQHTPAADSYGARRVLNWLAEGDLFDFRRWPVVTPLVGLGLLASLRSWRADERGRALVVAFALSLVLFFGRPTLGPLLVLLPGARDLFLRRFLVGVHLAGIYLAGMGAVALVDALRALARRAPAALRDLGARRGAALRRRALLAGAAVACLAPAWRQLHAYESLDAAAIRAQAAAEHASQREIGPLLAQIRARGGGRTYAGLPTNWGADFLVGFVPVFKYLANEDIDEVGYTLRTASLMTDPEAHFDELDPADYQLFGVRYLLLPATRTPPVRAELLARRGPYALWTIPSIGYVQVVDTVGTITASRYDLGAATAAFVRSAGAALDRYPTVAFDGSAAAAPTSPAGRPLTGPPGAVRRVDADLAGGVVRAEVVARRTAVVLLKASYDPGWRATVDGVPARPEMVAPALVGVRVGPGRHAVVFRYVGYGGYPVLFGLALATLALLAAVPLARRRLGARRRPRAPGPRSPPRAGVRGAGRG